MASWIPTNIGKKLLRYMLSYSGILDEQSLNLDSLDVALGLKNSVELRNVRLELNKLSTLLQLPPDLKPISGKISLLKIEIPTQIWSSSTRVQVSGVELQIKVLKPKDISSSTSQYPTELPTFEDVAKDFLADEPDAERHELEEAVDQISKSQANLVEQTSQSSEEEEESGLGQEMPLYGYIESAIKGIVDRLEVIIEDVSVSVLFDMPTDFHSGHGEIESSLRLHFEKLDVEGFTSTKSSSKHKGKRLILIDQLTAKLTATNDFFQSLQHSPSIPSRIPTQSVTSVSQTQSSPSISREREMSISQNSINLMEESIYHDQSPRVQRYFDNRFADASDGEDEHEDDDENESENENENVNNMDEFDDFLSNPIAPNKNKSSFEEDTGAVFPFDMDVSGLRASRFEESIDQLPVISKRPNISPTLSSDESSVGQEMTESVLYTHDQAQSMYESAMSEMKNSTNPVTNPLHVIETASITNKTSIDPKKSNVIVPQQLMSETPEVHTPIPQSPVINSISSNIDDSPATPTGNPPQRDYFNPVIVTKEVISIDQLAVLVPWAAKIDSHDLDVNSESVSSIYQSSSSQYFDMPGAFSYRTPESDDSKVENTDDNNTEQLKILESLNSVSDEADFQLVTGMIEMKLDSSSSKLLMTLFNQVIECFKNIQEIKQVKRKVSKNENHQDTHASGHTFSILLNKLKVIAQENLLVAISSNNTSNMASQLVFEVDKTEIFMDQKNAGSHVKLKTRNMSFGFNDLKLISFKSPIQSRYTQMSASTYFPDADQCDVYMLYRVTPERGPELDIETGKLLIDINLPQIDEKLGYYGGLSGILDISSSIMSHSIVLKSPTRLSTQTSTQSQHPSTEDSGSTPLKINARLNLIVIELKGSSSIVSIESDTIKLVVRGSNVRVQSPNIWLSGNEVEAKRLVTLKSLELIFSTKPEESDLDLLLSLITPSKDPYEDEDDIIVDTLVRQRQKGSLLRCTVDKTIVSIKDISIIAQFQSLATELSKFANVAKYLPDDDRPGLLSMIKLRNIAVEIGVGGTVGTIDAMVRNIYIAHVGLPSLLAMQVGGIDVSKDEVELVKSLLDHADDVQLPMLMAKMVGDELEPTVKVKIYNLSLEYRVSTLLAFMNSSDDLPNAEDLAASMIQSVATIRDTIMSPIQNEEIPESKAKPLRLSVLFRDCGIGLNPTDRISKGVFHIQDALSHIQLPTSKPPNGYVQLRKASLLVIDDFNILGATPHTGLLTLEKFGYQSLISVQSVRVEFSPTINDKKALHVQVDASAEVVIVETCADSTQTLIDLVDGLKPPEVPDKRPQYRTDAILPQEFMEEFSGEAFEQLNTVGSEASPNLTQDEEEELEDALSDGSYDMIGSFYGGSYDDDENVQSKKKRPIKFSNQSRSYDGPAFGSFDSVNFKVNLSDSTLFKSTNAQSSLETTSDLLTTWDSTLKQQVEGTIVRTKDCPLILNFRVTTFVWNLFDGYDWIKTRETIGEAVEKLRMKAAERRSHRRRSNPDPEDDTSEIGDTLFQSIYIAIPSGNDEDDLGRRINQNIRRTDQSTEASTITTAINQGDNSVQRRSRSQSLKLNRSRRYKASIEVRSLNLNLKILPPSMVSTQSILNIQVKEFEIFDHLATSTWRKFLTSRRDVQPPPSSGSMLHLELQVVKPQLDLAASELVMNVSVMPLRLHVDQDTLDFITRFFEFKDDSKPIQAPSKPPYIQRFELDFVPLRLDYKPKKVDYSGLRSGRTKEFMNFVTLDSADILLRHVILIGIRFDTLQSTLNDVFVNDIVRKQLPIVLQGLAPIRPIVNLAKGLQELWVVPIREYEKDGQLMRSIRKGAFSFAKTTSTELARLGGKVALGTGNLLSGAEALLSSPSDPSDPLTPSHDRAGLLAAPAPHHSSPSRSPTRPASDGRPAPAGTSFSSSSHTAAAAFSAYANQPLTLAAGIRSAMRHLERDLTSTRDAIIGVGTELRDSESAGDVVRAVARAAPVVILRPAVGVTRAMGVALLGAGNTIEGEEAARVLRDKYK